MTKQVVHSMRYALLAITCLCVLFAGEIRTEMQNALTRCFTVVIPSLYAMMILSQLLTGTGAWRILARPLRKITPKLFGMPDACFAVFLLSQFAGYPVGASMLRTLTEQGVLKQNDAGRLLWVCYGGGPAFLLGLLGNTVYQSQLFLCIFGANILSNFLLCALLFRRRPIRLLQDTPTATESVDASLFLRCTAAAGQTLLRLCGIILCFSTVCALMDALGIFRFLTFSANRMHFFFSLTDIAKSLLEITNAAELSLPFSVRIPVFAALLSFGGFCVILQICAVATDVIPMRHFILMRLIAAGLSALFCLVGMRFLPKIPTTAVPVFAAVSGTKPTFPMIMLFFMMLLLFREEHLLRKEKPSC